MFLSTYFWTKPHHTTILDSLVVLALPTVWLFKRSHFAIYSIHNTISLGHFSLMSWDSVNEGGLLKDLELRRVTINSHIFLVIDVLLVNKSYCALGHTWYHHWWWGNCDDELLAQAYGQGHPRGGCPDTVCLKKKNSWKLQFNREKIDFSIGCVKF